MHKWKQCYGWSVLRAAMALGTWGILMLCGWEASAWREAVYVEVNSDGMRIYEPDFRPFTVKDEEMRFPGNEFEKFLDWLEVRRDSRFVVLLLRPDSALFQRRLRTCFAQRSIDMVFEPLEVDEEVPLPVRNLPKEPEPAKPGSAAEEEEVEEEKRPLLFECRDNKIFRVDRDKIDQACEERAAKIFKDVNGDENEFLKVAATTVVEVDGYRVDFGLSMTGSYLLMPNDSFQGDEVETSEEEAGSGWFAEELARHDPKREFVCFFIRPNSVGACKRARKVAWSQGFSVTYELMTVREPIKLGVGGRHVDSQ